MTFNNYSSINTDITNRFKKINPNLRMCKKCVKANESRLKVKFHINFEKVE